MTINNFHAWKILHVLTLVSIFLLHGVFCQDDQQLDEEVQDLNNDNPAGVELFSNVAFNQFSNISSVFKDDIKKQFGFCITDV